MELAEELLELNDTALNPNLCGVKKLLKQLPDKEQKALLQVIENLDVPAPRISTMLSKHGYNLGRDTIRRHRNKGTGNGCSCR